MKLSFTTLGCPDWTLGRIIEAAKEYGFDAIDFRGLAGEMNIYRLPEFSGRAGETRDRIAAAGLQVSCFSSSVHAFSGQNHAANMAEIEEYAKLCRMFGTRYIRVFGGSIAGTERSEAVRLMAGHLRDMAAVAERYGVKLLLETHDDWCSCEHVKMVLERVDSDAVGVLWDVHHPYRLLGEQPETTWSALGRWIEYVHVKDSRLTGPERHHFQYCLTGEGDIPLERICRLLQQNGYEGYYTLEWEKKWHPELADADVAFPGYVQYMRRLMKTNRADR